MGFSILSETLCCGFQFFARWTAASISICLSTALLVSENIDVKVLFTILKKWIFCPCIYLFIYSFVCLSVRPSPLLIFFLFFQTLSSGTGPSGIPGIPGSRDFQLIKIPGFWKMKSRDFSGSACRVKMDFLWSVSAVRS